MIAEPIRPEALLSTLLDRVIEIKRRQSNGQKVYHSSKSETVSNSNQSGSKIKCGGEGSGTPGPCAEGGASESTGSNRSAVIQAVLGKTNLDAAKNSVASFIGVTVYAQLNPRVQHGLAVSYALGKAIEHKAMAGFAKGKQMAIEVAKARGLSTEHADRVGRIIGLADTALAWTVNFPGTLAATGSMTAAKVASFLPVASLAYISYSTARNPFAIIRAARSVLSKSDRKGMVRTAIKDMLEGFESSDPDWYEALLVAAFDGTGDLRKAVDMADQAIKAAPHMTGGEEVSEWSLIDEVEEKQWFSLGKMHGLQSCQIGPIGRACPSCGGRTKSDGRHIWCSVAPCEWSTKASYFEDCERDEGGHCLPSGASRLSGSSSDSAERAKLPDPVEDVDQIADCLRDAVQSVSGCSKDQCNAAAYALREVYPEADVYFGYYLGDAHVITKLGDNFIDVTADQFGGDDILITEDLPKEYRHYEIEPSRPGDVSEFKNGPEIAEKLRELLIDTVEDNKSFNSKCGGEGSGKPGPCPEGGAEANSSKPAAHAESNRALVSQGLEKANLTPEQQKVYAAAAGTVMDRMNAKAHERFAAHLTDGVSFHADTEGVRQELLKRYAKNPGDVKFLTDLAEKGMEIGGAFTKTGGKGGLVVDGAYKKPSSNMPTVTSIYAHEFSHAIDGPKYEISNSAEWKEAYEREIASGQLSRYAAVTRSRAEGFAEFGRLLLSGEHDVAATRQKFPRAYAVWEKHGIAPEAGEKKTGLLNGPTLKDSYFEDCPRDDEGHCLPSGRAKPEATDLNQLLEPMKVPIDVRKFSIAVELPKDTPLADYLRGIGGEFVDDWGMWSVPNERLDELEAIAEKAEAGTLKKPESKIPKSVKRVKPSDQDENRGKTWKEGDSWTMYRASSGDTPFFGQRSNWAERLDDARAYLDNPGFGGDTVFKVRLKPNEVLDLVDAPEPKKLLAHAISQKVDLEDSPWGYFESSDALEDHLEQEWSTYDDIYNTWENDSALDTILPKLFRWIRHNDESYPEGSTTWVSLRGIK